MALDKRDERISKLLEGINYDDYTNFKIVALYKTFAGEEFVEASLESIYRFMHKIVMVNSDTSWSGEKGNTVLPVVKNWIADGRDPGSKVVNLNVSMTSQDEQYKYGYDYIKKEFPEAKMVMLIDTDEVWDDVALHEFILRAFWDKEHNTFSCRLHTYIKSIHYKVEPMEWCKPTIFVRTTEPAIKGPRGINNSNKVLYNDIQAHHFTYVRKDKETVMKKIKTSFIGDGPGTHCVPMDTWIKEKWDKLPFATDFHTTKTAETSWHSIKPILLSDLPDAVKNNTKLINTLLPFGHLTGDDIEMLFKYSEGAQLAVDLGTYCGRSAITLSLHSRRVVTVDLFEDLALHPDDALKDAYAFYANNDTVFNNKFEDVKKTLDMYKHIEVRKAVTYEVAHEFDDDVVDVLFIDDDHSYKGVKLDFDNWFGKVKRGGYILFHDFNDNFPDVVSYIYDEIISRSDVSFMESSDTMYVIQKL